MNAVKDLFINSPTLAEFFTVTGPLIIAFVFVLASFFLARLTKIYSSKFIFLIAGEKKQAQIEKWSNVLFWLVFAGSIFLLGGFLYNSFAPALTKSAPTQKFGIYFSRFISALIAFIIGIILAGLTSTFIKGTLTKLNYPHANTFGRLAGIILAALFVIVAIEQLNININLIQNIIVIIIFLIGLSFSISLGLGSKQHSSQIISGSYMRNIYRAGMIISIDNLFKGRVVKVDTIATMLELDNKDRINIPNELLLSSVVIIHSSQSSQPINSDE